MKKTPAFDKLRGGYYTPESVARFLARWAIQSGADRVLEPSAGDGSIAVAAAERLKTLSRRRDYTEQLVAVELIPAEARKLAAALRRAGFAARRARVLQGDFFAHASDMGFNTPLFGRRDQFDAVVGNPPFIRYQSFPEEHRAVAFSLMNGVGLTPNRLTNAWLPFLVVSSSMVASRGRLAMIIPAELLQVSYAAEARRFLSSHFSRVTLITFRELLFPDAQQNVVLLLAEKGASRRSEIRVLELSSAAALEGFDPDGVRAPIRRMDHTTEKWTRYFLSNRALGLLRSVEAAGVGRVKDVAEVDVGVVTGENDFFLLNRESAASQGLSGLTRRILSKSAQVRGVRTTGLDYTESLRKEERVFLFAPPDEDVNGLPLGARQYVRRGERDGVHKGYKCRIRRRWYVVPALWVPDAFVLRQVHDYPRLSLNDADATSTDTVHRVRLRKTVKAEHVASAFVNSLTLAASEVTGRSYGGGVLTFEPTEVEKLPLPLKGAERLDLDQVDALHRERRVAEALDVVDRHLLEGGLGLSRREVLLLRESWNSLREKRVQRVRPRADRLAH